MTPTGTNETDFDLAAAIQEELRKMATASTDKTPPPTHEPPPTPAPIEIELDGQQYKFNSNQELSAAIRQFREQAQREIANARATPTKPAAAASGDDQPDWSQDKFIELMGKDVRKAFDYVDSHRYFNGKVENASSAIREQLEQAATVQKALSIEQFRQAHPEFPISNVAATQYVESVRQELNLPYNPQGLEAAYMQAYNRNPQFRQVVDDNFNQRPQQQQSQPQSTADERRTPFYTPPRANQQNNPYLAPPPSAGRTTVDAPSPYDETDLESLSADQIEKIINRMNKTTAR